MSYWQEKQEADQQYQSGYHANSEDECPYLVASGPYLLWMQGYNKHQADRRQIALKAADRYCQQPLTIRTH